jgi:hypothetical protein
MFFNIGVYEPERRGQDIFWQETPFLIGRKLLQPTLYIAGEEDGVAEFYRPTVDSLERSVPNLWKRSCAPAWGIGPSRRRRAK